MLNINGKSKHFYTNNITLQEFMPFFQGLL